MAVNLTHYKTLTRLIPLKMLKRKTTKIISRTKKLKRNTKLKFQD